jgi:putative DNA-invertase from lambdoid prophage Rac
MPSTFIYSNNAFDSESLENVLRSVDHAGYPVEIKRTFGECVSPSVSALNRPEMRRLIGRVCAGDTVIVLRLSCLGCSVRDALGTIAKFRNLGTRLYCVETGRADLAGKTPPAAVCTLQAVVKLENSSRSARVKDSVACAKAIGKRLGRRPMFSLTEQRTVLEHLACGTSVSEIARHFNTSRQTVLRIRSAHAPPGALHVYGLHTAVEAGQ